MLGCVASLGGNGNVYDSLVFIYRCDDSECAKVLVLFLGHKHWPVAGKKINWIDLILLNRFLHQRDGGITATFENFAKALRQVIYRKRELAARTDDAVSLELIVTFDEALCNQVAHSSCCSPTVLLIRRGKYDPTARAEPHDVNWVKIFLSWGLLS